MNSSRVVTDSSGAVAYSVTYSPYGGIEKVFTESYNPNPKFSGKEREGYSGWDYFGARYYDHGMYRFTSVDPIINKSEALTNPQLWNLYSYCRNNPITYLDPDGRKIIILNGKYNKEINSAIALGSLSKSFSNLYQKLDNDKRNIFIQGKNFRGVQTGQTDMSKKGLYVDEVTISVDFKNINENLRDKSGLATIAHELKHAESLFKSIPNNGFWWSKAYGKSRSLDDPIEGAFGSGTQRGIAGQFGFKVAREAITSLILSFSLAGK